MLDLLIASSWSCLTHAAMHPIFCKWVIHFRDLVRVCVLFLMQEYFTVGAVYFRGLSRSILEPDFMVVFPHLYTQSFILEDFVF